MVNFHALGWYARRHGGEALRRRRPPRGGRRRRVPVRRPAGGYAETRLAYDEAIARFSPERPLDARRGRRARRGAALGGGDRRAAAPERLGRVHAARRRSTRCASRPRDADPADAGGPAPRAVRDLRPPLLGARRRRPAVRDRAAALRDGGLRGRDRVLRGVAGAARPATPRPSRTSRCARPRSMADGLRGRWLGAIGYG